MDIYHGPALMQIVEDASFKALNKADNKYGHYVVNTDRRLFVKYSKALESPWPFTFQPAEMNAMAADIASGGKTFVCLICGSSTISCLTQDELVAVVNLKAKSAQWVKVEVPKGGSQWITGSKGRLDRSIPHNSFPSKVLA
jgi:hypothetical protein